MDAATLRAAMQETYVSDAVLSQYLPYFLDAMKAAEITTERRAAAWCSQLGHESAGLKYMAEIQTSDPSWSEDRTRYRGRGPIQLTWSSNYRKFGQWCKANGYVDDSELFVNQPELVEQPMWGFLAASWYWLNAGPRPGQINSFADAGDILAVSRCINGWVEGKEPNGYADRKTRWNRCLAMGSAILPDQNGATMPDYGITDVIHGYNPNTGDDCTGNSNGPRAQTLYFVVHTQQAHADAVSLANFCNDSWKTQPDNPVSYNLAVDDKRTVEIVPVGEGPWSAAEANDIAVHLCFAGSFAEWSTAQWESTDASDGLNEDAMLTRGAKAAAAACRQYGIPVVFADGTDWPALPKGITGHRNFGKRGGGHTDPGDGFPMTEFLRRVNSFMPGQGGDAPVTPPPPQVKRFPDDWTDRELMVEVLRQLRGPTLDGWPQLGNLSVVDALAKLQVKPAATRAVKK